MFLVTSFIDLVIKFP